MEKTTRFSLGFRLLARVEGRRWLSKIRRNTNTPNAAVTYHSSASRNQPPPQTSTSQSQVNRDSALHLPTKEDKTTTIMDAVMLQSSSKDKLPQEQSAQGTHNTVITDSDIHPPQDECEQQEEGKSGETVKNENEKVCENRNHIQEEIKDVGQRKNILEEECENQRSMNVTDQLDEDEDEDEKKRKSPNKECSIETQLRKAQRREILLARLRARIEKSEARFRYVEDEKLIIGWR